MLYMLSCSKRAGKIALHMSFICHIYVNISLYCIPHRPVHDGSVALPDLADSVLPQKAHLTPGTPLAIGSSVKQTAT